MEIEIYSDVVCPWCYVGKARLEAALLTYEGEVTLRWRPFQLDATAPRQARALTDWLLQRFESGQSADRYMRHITAVAEAEGLPICLERARIANTFDAHRLLWYSDQPEAVAFGAGPDTQVELADLIHRAYFAEGLDIGSIDVLIDLACTVGLDEARVQRLLTTIEGTADVRAQLAQAYDLGIASIPTFVFAGSHVLTGAQTEPTLRAALDEAVRREGNAPSLRSLMPTQRTAPAFDDPFSAPI